MVTGKHYCRPEKQQFLCECISSDLGFVCSVCISIYYIDNKYYNIRITFRSKCSENLKDCISKSCTVEGRKGTGKTNSIPSNEYFLDICAAPAGDLSWRIYAVWSQLLEPTSCVCVWVVCTFITLLTFSSKYLVLEENYAKILSRHL